MSTPLDAGAAVVTGGGDLTSPLVLHVVLQDQDEAVGGRDTIRRALQSAWQRAADWQLEHLAAPPIGAGRPGTLKAIEAALTTPEKLVFAVSQRENVENVNADVLYTIGTVARIGQMQRGLAGVQLLLQGEYRGIAMHYFEQDGYLAAVVRTAEEMAALNPEDPAFVALHREARARAAELGQKSGLPEEVVQQVLGGVNEPGRFAEYVVRELLLR